MGKLVKDGSDGDDGHCHKRSSGRKKSSRKKDHSKHKSDSSSSSTSSSSSSSNSDSDSRNSDGDHKGARSHREKEGVVSEYKSGSHNDVEMEKFIEEVSVPEITYAEPTRVNGGGDTSTEMLSPQVSEVVQERALAEDATLPAEIESGEMEKPEVIDEESEKSDEEIVKGVEESVAEDECVEGNTSEENTSEEIASKEIENEDEITAEETKNEEETTPEEIKNEEETITEEFKIGEETTFKDVENDEENTPEENENGEEIFVEEEAETKEMSDDLEVEETGAGGESVGQAGADAGKDLVESPDGFDDKKYGVVISESESGIHGQGESEGTDITEDNTNSGFNKDDVSPEPVREVENPEPRVVNTSESEFCDETVESEPVREAVNPEPSQDVEDSTPSRESLEEVFSDSKLPTLEYQSSEFFVGSDRTDSAHAFTFEGESEMSAKISASEIIQECTENMEVGSRGNESEVEWKMSSESKDTTDRSINSEVINDLIEDTSSTETEGTSGHDERDPSNGARDTRRNLSVELLSPMDVQKRFLSRAVTPSPTRREGSQVYNIVMALEGLQIGEKCIHGEIDHGLCHARQGDRKSSYSHSYSSPTMRVQQETSMSSREEGYFNPSDHKSNVEVTLRDGEKTELHSHTSFVQHDAHSGQTIHKTYTTTTETYTDTVMLRKEDGFLPRTPGRSSLSKPLAMGTFSNQAGFSESTTPRLKIVHEFPTELNDGETHASASTSTRTIEGESEVERILRLQETHDLICPVCSSCITKRVILRKRKRTTVISSVDRWETEVLTEEENSEVQAGDTVGDNVEGTVVEKYEDYGCLACFTFLFRRERSVQRSETVAVLGAEEASERVSIASSSQINTSNQSVIQSTEEVVNLPSVVTNEDYDNRCLPIFFTWRRKTTSPVDSEVMAPLLGEEKKESIERDSHDEDSVIQSEVVSSTEIHASESEQRSASSSDVGLGSEAEQLPAIKSEKQPVSEIEQHPASEIVVQPVAPAREFQIPVVVMESREDRLCFPFFWRKSSRITEVQSEHTQPLMTKDDIYEEHESTDREIKHSTSEDNAKKQSTDDFSNIGDDLWMYPEQVPLSVAPQEEPPTPGFSRTTDSSEASAELEMPVKTIRITEAERRTDCLCFPSWRSSETVSEEIEVIPSVINSVSDASSVAFSSKVGGQIQESTSTLGVVPLNASGTDVTEISLISSSVKDLMLPSASGSEGFETFQTSPSLKEGLLPVATVTDERVAQRATINCMDFLLPAYPWGPPGTGRTRDILERRDEQISSTSTKLEFNTVTQAVGEGVGVALEQSVTDIVEKPESSPLNLIVELAPPQTTSHPHLEKAEVVVSTEETITKETKSRVLEELSENEISMMRREDSRCLPLLLPTISWRRSDLSAEGKTGSSHPVKTEETDSALVSESTSHITTEATSQRGKEVQNGDEFSDIEILRDVGQIVEGDFSDSETVDQEEVPLTRKPPTSKLPTPSKVESMIVEVQEESVASSVLEDSSHPEVHQRDFSFIEEISEHADLSELPPDREIFEEESREKATWTCCVPGSCLPSYSLLAYQTNDTTVERRPLPESPDEVPAASALDAHKETRVGFHDEVTRHTTIDARIVTETVTTTVSDQTDEEHGDTIQSVKVDTSVSYVHALVEQDGVKGTPHGDDYPTSSIIPVEEDSLAPDSKETGLVLESQISTGYAVLDDFYEGVENATINEMMSSVDEQDSNVEPLPSEHVTEEEQPARVTDSIQLDTGREIRSDADFVQAQQPVPVQDADASCCLPNSKWIWGRWKPSVEEAELRIPLLGSGSEQMEQHTYHLDVDSEASSKDSSAHVTVEQTHEVTTTTATTPTVAGGDAELDHSSCSCFPWRGRYDQEVATTETTVTVTTDHAVIDLEGTDAASTLLAATRAAEDAGLMDESRHHDPEYLKSIVYGGLDVSLTSLGVIASGAGGDVKTRNVLALGLANLFFGFLTFFHKIQDLHKDSPGRFQESVGPRFLVNGPLAILSFLLFGSLPVLTFGFSFRQSNDHDYKMAVTVIVSTIAIALLGCGKVAAKMTTLSYWRSVSTLIVSGVIAAVACFYTGEYISHLLQKYGILDE